MNAQTIDHKTYLLIRENHAIIGELMTSALRAVTERHEPVPRVAHLMGELRDRVADRFEEEVDNGMFRNLTALAPRFQHEISSLRDEHEQLLAEIAAICQRTETDSLSAADWEELELRLHEFSSHFTRHETREQDLILGAYDDDLGSGD